MRDRARRDIQAHGLAVPVVLAVIDYLIYLFLTGGPHRVAPRAKEIIFFTLQFI